MAKDFYSEKTVKNALQNIYNELEAAKDANVKNYAQTSLIRINNALSELMKITEELEIPIKI